MTATTSDRTSANAGVVLASLAAGQPVMALDTSVMNVSMVQVANDVGTDITGIQTAITLYALVMASLMITGGKVGQILGRKRAFMLGGVVYGAGSLTTAFAPSLPVLLVGWSLLEGIGVALIPPAIVALVASNFGADDRPKAYGMIAAAASMALAAGPLIGGLCTTYLSWRVVFVGEVVVLAGVLSFARRMDDVAPEPGCGSTSSARSGRSSASARWCSVRRSSPTMTCAARCVPRGSTPTRPTRSPRSTPRAAWPRSNERWP